MVTKVEEPTAFVLTVKVAVEAPLGTITLDGTVAAPVLLLDRETTAPPLGADALNCTVPVEELPPVTLDGLRPSETRSRRGGDVTVRVIVVVFVRVPEAPVMVTVTVPVAAVLFAVNLNVLVVVVGFGLKEAVTPLGSVEGDRATLPEKPFSGETVIVLEPLGPWGTGRLPGEAERVGGRARWRGRPFGGATVIVLGPLLPWVTVRLPGEAERV